MISNELKGELQNEIKILYQNYEQEAIKAYMPLIKALTNAVLPYTATGGKGIQNIIQGIQNGVEAYKHTDIIGMADALATALININERQWKV